MGYSVKELQRRYVERFREAYAGQTLPWRSVMEHPVPNTIWGDVIGCDRQKLYRAAARPDIHWLRIGLDGDLILLKAMNDNLEVAE